MDVCDHRERSRMYGVKSIDLAFPLFLFYKLEIIGDDELYFVGMHFFTRFNLICSYYRRKGMEKCLGTICGTIGERKPFTKIYIDRSTS